MRTSDRPRLQDGNDPAAAAAQPGDLAVPGDGGLRITAAATPLRLVLAGDIDLTTHAALAAALAGAADSDGQLHLDLAGVRFCDVVGMRILLRGSQRKPQAVLHNLPPHLRKLRHLLDGDPAPDRTADDRPAPPRAGTADEPAAAPPAARAGPRCSPGQEMQPVPAPARPGHRHATRRPSRRADA